MEAGGALAASARAPGVDGQASTNQVARAVMAGL